MTHAELAKKFGWPSVIISTVLLPFNLFWVTLVVAFPIRFKSTPKFTVDNCHIDEEGGKFFQSSRGIIHCLDIEVKRDDNDRISRMIFTPNFFSWFTLDKGYVEFANTPQGTFGHRLRFFYPLHGQNMRNPLITLHSKGFVMSGMGLFSNVSFNEEEDVRGATAISRRFSEEQTGKEREDRFRYK